MVDYLRKPVIHEAFFKKYASKKFLKGKWERSVPSIHPVLTVIASIHTRNWAKANYAKYLDDPFLSTDIASVIARP